MLAFAAGAETPASDVTPVLVELFSSQSCGSCPTANENLIDLAEDPHIFPIVWSVSYWEYLGDEEPYASPEFLSRQRTYADSFSLRGPYTPQVVVDGCMQNTGMSPDEIRRKIHHADMEVNPDISVTMEPDAVRIAPIDTASPSDVWLVGYRPGITELTPDTGRNAGKTLRHAHMATSLQNLGLWDGQSEVSFDVQCPAEACLVIVQESGSQEILHFEVMPSFAAG